MNAAALVGALLEDADLAGFVEKAKVELDSRLKRYGIDDRIVVRMKPAGRIKADWIACYRGMSALRGGTPIFWVPDNFLQIAQEVTPGENPYSALVQTLFHEYGHVIAEWADKARSPGYFDEQVAAAAEQVFALIQSSFSDAEEYCEDFAHFLDGDGFANDEAHLKIMSIYAEAMFS